MLCLLYAMIVTLSLSGAAINPGMLPAATTICCALSAICMSVVGDGCYALMRTLRDTQCPGWRNVVLKAVGMASLCLLVLPMTLMIAINHSLSAALYVAIAGMTGLLLVLLRRSLHSTSTDTLLWRSLLIIAPLLMVIVVVRELAQVTIVLSLLLLLLIAVACRNASCLLSRQPERWLATSEHNHPTHRPANINYSFRHIKPGVIPTMRVFLGKPYAPVTGKKRLQQLALLIAILVMPSVVLFIGDSDHSSAGFLKAWRLTAPLVTCLIAIVIWIIFMYRAHAAMLSGGLQLSELALLPHLGSSRKQLGGLLYAWFGAPTLIVIALMLLGQLSAPKQTRQFSLGLWACIAMFLLLSISQTLVGMLTRTSRKSAETPSPPKAGLWETVIAPAWISLWLCFVTFSSVQYGPFSGNHFLRWFSPGLCLAFLLLGAIHIYRLARRPHPFVETER